jgi:tRNA threonylcarbamoyladenosine biosynthesis protein TsaE
MIKKHEVRSPEETESIGRSLAKALEEAKIKRAFIALFGEMGVGKTAFTRGFASHFGITTVKSPTYTVLNEYRGRAPIHHFDFYRISDGDDLYSIGFDDLIEAPGYCIGEWSENIVDFLPDDAIYVKISRVSNDADDTLANARIIEIESSYEAVL